MRAIQASTRTRARSSTKPHTHRVCSTPQSRAARQCSQCSISGARRRHHLPAPLEPEQQSIRAPSGPRARCAVCHTIWQACTPRYHQPSPALYCFLSTPSTHTLPPPPPPLPACLVNNNTRPVASPTLPGLARDLLTASSRIAPRRPLDSAGRCPKRTPILALSPRRARNRLRKIPYRQRPPPNSSSSPSCEASGTSCLQPALALPLLHNKRSWQPTRTPPPSRLAHLFASAVRSCAAVRRRLHT